MTDSHHKPQPKQLDLTLPAIRQQITEVDQQLLSLLARRRDLSRCVAMTKAADSKAIRDQPRESELLEALINKGSASGLDSYYVTNIFHTIIEDSLNLQKDYLQTRCNPQLSPQKSLNIAVLGGQGAYSYLAACQHFKSTDNAFLACSSFEKVLKSVEQGKTDYGVIPIENSTSGAITEVYDLLLNATLSIVGEEKYLINHCLISKTPIPTNQINKIYAHPEASRQCSHQLKQQIATEICLVSSTAEALKRVKQDTNQRTAAIASEKSALELGLHVLQKDIANLKDNTTRFLVLAKTPVNVSRQVDCKTSIALSTGQQPGALAEVLLVFRDACLPLNRLESRPIAGKPWEQMFYLDFTGNTADKKVVDALDHIAKICRFIKVLGSYPCDDISAIQVSTSALSKAKFTAGASADNDKTSQKNHPKATTLQKVPRLTSRHYKQSDTIIDVKGVKFGGNNFTVIGGPSAVESAEQITACAQHAKETGASVLRGNCFIPPTEQARFLGLEFDGLNYLRQAAQNYALPNLTEVISTDHIRAIAAKVDILQIGARNMQNFALLKAVGQINTPVMLKRDHMSSIDELLNAAQYILLQGNKQVILCEQGSRTFETARRNTLDFSAVPLIKQCSHLPIIVDPSHAVGQRTLVTPMTKAARAVGAHGVMVEFHPNPDAALNGAQEALNFDDFAQMMYELHTS